MENHIQLINATIQSMRRAGLALLPLLLLAGLSGCGSSVQPRSTTGFSGSGPLTSTPVTANSDAVAECLSFDSSKTTLSGRLTTYYYNGTLVSGKVRLRITSLSGAFDTKASTYLKIFRWKVGENNTAVLDSESPVSFNFENGAGSSSPVSADMTSINATQIGTIRKAQFIAGTTSAEFFNNTTMVLSNVDYEWQAIKIVLYDGTTVLGDVDVLLVPIQANPTRYYNSHSSLLSQLHPFWSQYGSSQTETQWAAQVKPSCF